MTEIKPCPFCGGDGSGPHRIRYSRPLQDVTWEDGSEITEAFHINCVRCGISNGSHGLCNGYRTPEDAARRWNTRTPDPSLLNGLREAREALAGLLAHPGTHHDRCIHWEEVGCDCEFSEITNGARTVIANLDTLLSQEGQP